MMFSHRLPGPHKPGTVGGMQLKKCARPNSLSSDIVAGSSRSTNDRRGDEHQRA